MLLNQLALTVGIVLSYLIDYVLAGAHAWRWMFGLAAVPAATLCVGMIGLPPSPRWLLARNRGAAAQDTLRRIRGLSDVSAEMAEIRLIPFSPHSTNNFSPSTWSIVVRSVALSNCEWN